MLKTVLIAFTCLVSVSILADETNGNPAEIYHDFCSVCHGDSGKGAVWAQSGLDPLPVDFTDPQVWMKLKNRDRMVRAVTYGIPQTAMAGWGNRLSEQDIGLVVDFVRDAFMNLSLIPDYETAEESTETAMDMNTDADGHQHDAHGALHVEVGIGALEFFLEQQGKTDLLKEVSASSELGDIHYIRQKDPLGLGHAVSVAREHVGDEPFAVMLGDEMIDEASRKVAIKVVSRGERAGFTRTRAT